MRPAHLLLISLAACGGGGGDDDGATIDAARPDAGRPDAAAPFDPLVGIGDVELVDDGYEFVEGPQWVPSIGLLFSDIPADTIYVVAPPAPIAVFRMPSGNSNGLAVAPDGRLLAAEHGNRRVSIAPPDRDGAPVEVVASYQGLRLNSPNDVVASANGTIYFTDPPYGIDDSARELDFVGIFRVSPGDTEPIPEEMGALSARPNGIGLAPDQNTLYVADTDAGTLRAWDVDDDGSLSGVRTVSTEVPGADGLAVDVGGNLFVTTSAGVRVLAPDGSIWGTIAVPEQPANCAFGDADLRTLYITARTALYQVRLANPGLPNH